MSCVLQGFQQSIFEKQFVENNNVRETIVSSFEQLLSRILIVDFHSVFYFPYTILLFYRLAPCISPYISLLFSP